MTNYYAAYAVNNGGKIVGIAYQTIGKKGGRHKARWLEPIRRHVTKDELSRYKFHSYRFSSASVIDWVKDGDLRDKGVHIES